MNNLTHEYILLSFGIIMSLLSLGFALKTIIKDFNPKKLNVTPDTYLNLCICVFCAVWGGWLIKTNSRDIYDEKHAVYNSVQDTLVVTGTYPSIERYNHVHGQYREYEYNHISAIDKNNQEYNMQFYADGKEPTFVERGDTIVVNFQYRNGERMTDKDSIVANLTRNRLINQIIKKNNQNNK